MRASHCRAYSSRVASRATTECTADCRRQLGPIIVRCVDWQRL